MTGVAVVVVVLGTCTQTHTVHLRVNYHTRRLPIYQHLLVVVVVASNLHAHHCCPLLLRLQSPLIDCHVAALFSLPSLAKRKNVHIPKGKAFFYSPSHLVRQHEASRVGDKWGEGERYKWGISSKPTTSAWWKF